MGMRRAGAVAATVGGTRKRRERKVESHRAGGRAKANNVSGLPQCSEGGPRSPQNLPAKTRWMKFALPSLVS